MPLASRLSALVPLICALLLAVATGADAQAPLPLGLNFKISPGPDGIGGRPAIASDGVNFFVVWRHFSTNGYDIYGTRVSRDGTVLDPSGIPISTAPNYDPSPGNQYLPSVAFDGTNYLVVWTANRNPSSVDYEIYGARVARDGGVLDPAGLQITSGAEPLRMPSIAFDGQNYLVAWRTTGSQIRATRVSKSGAALDGPAGFLIGNGFYPWVAFDGTNYTVVWHAWGINGLEIFGARVAKAGSVLGSFPVSTAPEDQDHASIAFDGTNYLVVWHDFRGGNDWNDGSVYGARVSKSGTVLDDPAVKIADYARGQVPVGVAFDGTEYLVVWQVDNWPANYRNVDVHGRRVSTGGVVPDEEGIPVAAAHHHQWGPVIGTNRGRYLVAWTETSNRGGCTDGCVYGQLLERPAPAHPTEDDPEGLPALPAERPLNPAEEPWVAEASPTGEALHDVWGFDDAPVYAVGEDGRVIRYNGSQWMIETQFSRGRQFGVWGSSPQDIWSVGWCWDIFHYDGSSWSSANCQVDYPIGMGVWGSGSANVLTVGVLGGFIRYDGATWAKEPTGVSVELWDVWGTSADHAYAVGEFGTVLRHDGSTWTKEADVPTLQSLNGIWGSSRDNVFVVGDFGTILRYDGASWGVQESGTTEHLYAVWGCDASHIYAVGANGTILRYDGTRWASEASGTSATLLALWGGGNAIRATGDHGVILRKTAACNTPADLVAAAVGNPPATALPGGSFSVTDTTRNQGTGAAGASTTRYYLSLDRVRNSGDLRLAGSRAVPGLGVEAQSTGSATVRIPSLIGPGTYYVLACADDLGAVGEFDETNNCRASTTGVKVLVMWRGGESLEQAVTGTESREGATALSPPSPGPSPSPAPCAAPGDSACWPEGPTARVTATRARPAHLVATAVSDPPASAAPGGSFQVTDTVENQGAAPAASSTTRYYLSQDGMRTPGPTPLLGSRTVAALGPGAESTGTITVTIPSGARPGSYFVVACAGAPIERDGSQNCLASATPLRVAP